MDFISQLPLLNNFVSIVVVLDRFSKMAIFIPAYGAITSLESAQIIISHVFSKHEILPGEKVWLASKNIKTTRATKKLTEEWVGPFEVIKKIGRHDYHLKLPLQWKAVHPVFHVSLLEPVKQSSIPDCNQLPLPPTLVEKQEEWEVAQVLGSKLKRDKLWYFVEWKGFSEEPERTARGPASTLTSSPDLSKDLHAMYPDKPGSITSRV
ncbi:hypothetical protein O181_003259 [Austropuccinia psidii MF-1]|uniref:Tf2-1-like SH3-like domain-containing protein n=1 Tax=Austropuccinia psidii MF-1 TaxID=1389203 RepID=A0A9Q3BDT2_9BASI|nr:hypothetical protein [Austropuccinia psidii MF-1]